jgi:hypothetical protein
MAPQRMVASFTATRAALEGRVRELQAQAQLLAPELPKQLRLPATQQPYTGGSGANNNNNNTRVRGSWC